MSKETLDYLKLCPNYYTNWEDGCCMENCTFNDLDECPIHYVNGLLEEKDQRIADLEAKLTLTEKALERCYEYHKKHSTPADRIYHISKEEYIKEMMKSE